MATTSRNVSRIVNSDVTSLERLHDIVVPPPIPWWPPAPGWLWLFGFLLVLLLVLLFRAFLRWQKNLYRLEALAELRKQEALLQDPAQRPAALATLAILLKRAALSAWPREQIASLTGASWFNFLDRTGRTNAFSNGVGALLERGVYEPRSIASLSEDQLREVVGVVRNWLRQHQREDH